LVEYVPKMHYGDGVRIIGRPVRYEGDWLEREKARQKALTCPSSAEDGLDYVYELDAPESPTDAESVEVSQSQE